MLWICFDIKDVFRKCTKSVPNVLLLGFLLSLNLKKDILGEIENIFGILVNHPFPKWIKSSVENVLKTNESSQKCSKNLVLFKVF